MIVSAHDFRYRLHRPVFEKNNVLTVGTVATWLDNSAHFISWRLKKNDGGEKSAAGF